MGIVYSVINGPFASKDPILGWCVWSEGFDPAPLSTQSDEQLSYLNRIFSMPLYKEVQGAVEAEVSRRKAQAHADQTMSVVVVEDTDTTPVIVDQPDRPVPEWLKNFKVPEERPAIVKYVDVQGETGILYNRFGPSWAKVPGRQGVFYARDKTRPVQMTMIVDSTGTPIEFAIYQEETFEIFKERFMANQLDARFFPLGDRHCMGQRIIAALKADEVW